MDDDFLRENLISVAADGAAVLTRRENGLTGVSSSPVSTLPGSSLGVGSGRFFERSGRMQSFRIFPL